ncbi:hypothetical protein AC578_2928 [Pseudocercospora eumusae]|uniref:Uncharacterized protein n=1 Tax=Pseudocercospora eumusae TaxID=321146 RepID=A0A139HEK9_9PEZI|nr:hypothetical protein AC578_2928 [Pseudocercospora eumusae]
MSAPAGQPEPKADTLEKAVDSIEKKIGQSTGHPVDTNKYREKNEKFTDKLRAFIEKKTGKKLPAKVSN